MRVGIISSQRNPPDYVNWMRFHVDVGIDAFYITIEDTPWLGPAMASLADQFSRATGRHVTVYYEDAAPVNRSKEDNYSDLITRQKVRVDHMLRKARADGVDWAFHIDDDELLYPGSKYAISTWPEILNTVPKRCASIHLQNWEGFSPKNPSGSWITDRNVQYLPQSCGRYFAAYANGKAGSRTLPTQSSHGPHHFKGGEECELPETRGVLLHHEALAMGPDDVPPERWIQKNQLRLNDDLSRIPFAATHDAIKAIRSDDIFNMEQVWKKYRSVTGSRFKSCPTPVQLTLPSHFY